MARCGSLFSTWLLAALVGAVTAVDAAAATVRVPLDYPTIQSAINAIVNGSVADESVIEVQPGVYAEALVIANTAKSMTIRGIAGPAATIIDATTAHMTALQVLAATGIIRIEGLTIRGGNGNGGQLVGGGFTFHDSSPTLTGVIIEQNSAHDGAGGVMFRSNPVFAHTIIRNNIAQRFGGGLVIVLGSRPVFTHCHILGNQSGVGSNIGSGGGVHVNDASPTFRGCLIANNRSKFAAGGIMHLGQYGSAYGISRLVLEDTQVTGNVTERFSAADNPAEGGGVHIEDHAVASLTRVTVTGNTANTGGGLNAYRARYEIVSSTIEGNHAPDPQGVGGFGGGIALTSNNVSAPLRPAATIVIVDSAVRGNDARIGGGLFATGDQVCGGACNPATALRANVQLSGTIVSDNAASAQSGGMRLDRADATLLGSHVINNTVAASGQSYGGGLLIATGSVVTLDGVTIARNQSVDFGGGLFVESAAQISMTNSRVYGNTSGSGGGLYVGSNGPPSGTIQNSTIADNSTYQIHEQACSPLQRTILVYANNVITPRAGFSDLYNSTCGGATSTISAFNALASGRAFGNTSAVPSFVALLAAPKVDRAVLSWSVSRASSVTLSDVNTFAGHSGTTTVTPAPTATYQLTSTGGPAIPASQTVLAGVQWGLSIDVPAPGDYDGDGRNDFAIYRYTDATWYIALSSGGTMQQAFGAAGDLVVPGDYDGDGRTDLALFRPFTGTWHIRRSSDAAVLVVSWGSAKIWDPAAPADTPVPGDYDNDGKTDIAIFRSSTAQWFVRRSSGGTSIWTFGQTGGTDVPVAADYDGDGQTDSGVYRTSTGEWFIWRSSQGPLTVLWGTPPSLYLDDVPIPADYDGDGKADLAVVRMATGDWYIRKSTGGTDVRRVGAGDFRVSGDYAGVNRAQIAIYRAASGTWLVAP
jgi:hypothetical protein